MRKITARSYSDTTLNTINKDNGIVHIMQMTDKTVAMTSRSDEIPSARKKMR